VAHGHEDVAPNDLEMLRTRVVQAGAPLIGDLSCGQVEGSKALLVTLGQILSLTDPPRGKSHRGAILGGSDAMEPELRASLEQLPACAVRGDVNDGTADQSLQESPTLSRGDGRHGDFGVDDACIGAVPPGHAVRAGNQQ
jgi:hypothetical protein